MSNYTNNENEIDEHINVISKSDETICEYKSCEIPATYNRINNIFRRCEEHKYTIRYNNKLLDEFCHDNLLENIKTNSLYKEQKKTGPKLSGITRDTIITGKCKYTDCYDDFKQTFRELVEYGRYYCRPHLVTISNERRINTTRIIYGVDYVHQSDTIRQKSNQTCSKKYNAPTPFQSKQIQEKIKQTNMNNFGGTNPSQNPLVQEKKKQNNILKYGTPSLMQVPHIRDKIMKNAYKRKIYISPLGVEKQIQGYENYALDYLLKVENIDEDDILYGAEDTSKIFEYTNIWYDDLEGNKHPHYVDIYIISQNRCVEVKSTWTALKKQDSIYLKKQAAEKNGLIYEIWIYNHKGLRISNLDEEKLNINDINNEDTKINNTTNSNTKTKYFKKDLEEMCKKRNIKYTTKTTISQFIEILKNITSSSQELTVDEKKIIDFFKK